MKKRAVVTGLGAVTPVGNNVTDFWESIIAGKSGIVPLSQLSEPERFTSRVVGEIKNFDPKEYMNPKEARRTDWFVHYAIASAKMAVDDCKFDTSSGDPFRFIDVWIAR